MSWSLHSAVLVLAAMAGDAPSRLPGRLGSPACVACDEEATAVRGSFTDREWNAIQGGEIVTSETPDGGAARQRASGWVGCVVRHPPTRVWQVLADFESRPNWVPSMTASDVVRVDGDRVWVDEKLDVPLGTLGFRIVNTLEPEHGTIRFVLDESVPHDVAEAAGSWRVLPWADGRQTLVVYRSAVDAGRQLPSFVQRFLLRRSLPHVLTSLRARVDRIVAGESP